MRDRRPDARRHLGWASRHEPAQTIPLESFATLALLALPRLPLTVLGIQIANLALVDVSYGFTNPFPHWLSLCTVAATKPRRVSKTHVSSVLRKLQLRDRVQAVVAAYDAGLVRPNAG